MKKLLFICALAVAVVVSTAAYAEVQSVKVSGDLAVRSIMQKTLDLDKNDDTTVNQGASSTFLMSVTEVQIDADLTDNVSTVVRLANQRDWNDTDSANDDFQVELDLANVTLKEMLYSPLTLTIGRQDLFYGKGLIVGLNTTTWDNEGVIGADEYSTTGAFDAISATLDYDPWTVDLVYAVIDEGTGNLNDDVSLLGVNVGYIFDSYNGEAEGYIFVKVDDSTTAAVDSQNNKRVENDVATYGLRGSFDPIEQMTVALEGAYQGGRIYTGSANRSRAAYAFDIYGEYRFPDVKYTPTLSLNYVIYSGQDVNDTDGNWEGWDNMYCGKFNTAIRDFSGTGNLYPSTQGSDPSTTNQHQIAIKGQIKPLDDVTVDATIAHFWLDDDAVAGTTQDELGDEVDILLTYDYTADVEFSLLSAFYRPGDYYAEGTGDDNASELVGSMKVSF